VDGLEAALVDKEMMAVSALEASDSRRFQVFVAGPSALLVAKLYKIWERRNSPQRQKPKDALDVYRLRGRFVTWKKW
jgi:hypothetical protein